MSNCTCFPLSVEFDSTSPYRMNQLKKRLDFPKRCILLNFIFPHNHTAYYLGRKYGYSDMAKI